MADYSSLDGILPKELVDQLTREADPSDGTSGDLTQALAQPRTSLVFKQPGAPIGENEYSSALALSEAMDQIRGGGRVLLDPSFAGAAAGFDLDVDMNWKSWEIVCENIVPGSGAFVPVRVPDGVTLAKYRRMWGPCKTIFTGTGTAPCRDFEDGEELIMEGGATIDESGGAPLMDATSMSGLLEIRMRSVSSFSFGGTPFFTSNPGSILLFVLDNSVVNASTIGGGAAFVFYVKASASGRIDGPQDVGVILDSLAEVPAYVRRSTKSGTFTALFGAWDPINATSAVTLNLPTGTAFDKGKSVNAFIRTGAGVVTVTPAGGQTVVGAATGSGVGTRIHATFDGVSSWDLKIW